MQRSLRPLFLDFVAQTSDTPLGLEVDRAQGVYIYDRAGKGYIDLISGIGVSVLGHCHPEVVEAVQAQAARYMHTMVYGEHIQQPQVQLAQALAAALPSSLCSVYFVNSGAEAVEGAMKLAKRATGRREIVACREAYHGSTQGAASLNSDAYYTQAYRPLLPGIRHIGYNCMGDLARITTETAAVFVETVQGEAGVIPPQPAYLVALRARCSEVGALLVLDEVQVGMGRTGTLWAFEQFGIIPDVLLLAKGLGGGMPIGAFIANRELMKVLSFRPILGHITTFGGHPVSCAAALATLQVLRNTPLVAWVQSKAQLFRTLLQHRCIREVRNAGLLMGVELPSFEFVLAVMHYSMAHGVLTDWFLFNNRSVRIAPPLTIEPHEIRQACAVLLEAIEVTARQQGL